MGYVEAITDNRHGMVHITLDDGQTVTFRTADADRLGIPIGSETTKEELEQKRLEMEYPDALHQAVSFLAMRPHGVRELARKLTERGFSPATAEMAVVKLQKENLLNDEDFSRQWTHYRSDRYGPEKIYRELRMKGVDEETAKNAVSDTDPEDIENAAYELAVKGMRGGKSNESLDACRQRVIRLLVRRGYSWETARKAFDRAAGER